jgi:hypothetical protein
MTNENLAEKYRGKEKEWSIMVYLAGGMDVSDEARESLLRMKQIGSTENIHVIAQFDSGSEGTFTKRYYLTPFKDAMGIETLLRQACAEVPATLEPDDETAGIYYCQRMREALSENSRKRFDALKTDEMTALIRYSPDRYKSFVLNCILDEDIYPGPDGNLGDTNAGELKTLVDFVRWAKVYYPAKKSMVVLWGHGSGLSVAWDYPSSPFGGSADALTVKEMGKAFDDRMYEKEIQRERKKYELETGKRAGDYKVGVDIVGFNSCSLGTIEVYRQLMGQVTYGIASEGFTPKTSWPYDRILQALVEALAKDPAIGAKAFADKVVAEYIDYYHKSVKTAEKLQKIERQLNSLGTRLDMNTGWGQYGSIPDLGSKKTNVDLGFKKTNVDLGFKKTNVDLGSKKTNVDLGSQIELARSGIDLSVCKLAESQKVTEAMKALVEALKEKLNPLDHTVFSAILGAHAVSQSYFNRDFTDLFDFCRALHKFCPDSDIKRACQSVMDAIKTMCPDPNHCGEEVRNSYGVSIFFPWAEWGDDDLIAKYKDLHFLAETDWDGFLKAYRALVNDFETKKGVFK